MPSSNPRTMSVSASSGTETSGGGLLAPADALGTGMALADGEGGGVEAAWPDSDGEGRPAGPRRLNQARWPRLPRLPRQPAPYRCRAHRPARAARRRWSPCHWMRSPTSCVGCSTASAPRCGPSADMRADAAGRWISDDGLWIFEAATDRWLARTPPMPPPSEVVPPPPPSEVAGAGAEPQSAPSLPPAREAAPPPLL